MGTRIFTNAKIITVDDQFSVQLAMAFTNGRITAIGANNDVLAAAGPRAEVADLGGATVIPGLIDNHNHFVRGTQHWPSEVRLEGVTSRDEVLRRLRERSAGLEPGDWLLTLGGWHTDQLRGDRSDLTLAELDAVAGEHPAFVQVGYSHAFVNTALLRAFGGEVPGLVRGADVPSWTGTWSMAACDQVQLSPVDCPANQRTRRVETVKMTANGGPGIMIPDW